MGVSLGNRRASGTAATPARQPPARETVLPSWPLHGTSWHWPSRSGRRYRLAKEAYTHAKAMWKDQAEVYRLCRRRVRAFRHEVYEAREALRADWR